MIKKVVKTTPWVKINQFYSLRKGIILNLQQKQMQTSNALKFQGLKFNSKVYSEQGCQKGSDHH